MQTRTWHEKMKHVFCLGMSSKAGAGPGPSRASLGFWAKPAGQTPSPPTRLGQARKSPSPQCKSRARTLQVSRQSSPYHVSGNKPKISKFIVWTCLGSLHLKVSVTINQRYLSFFCMDRSRQSSPQSGSRIKP
jgi:hypothetical protein